MNRPITPFGEAFEIVSDRGVRIPQSEYQPEGPIPVVDQGRDLVGGFTTRLDAVVDTELPLIVFGDHTRRLKFIDFPFAVGAQGVKLLRPRGQILPRYAFYMLRAVPLEDRGYGRHFALLRKVAIPVPSPDEQRRIVDILEDHLSRLDAADAYLDASQRRLDALRSAVLGEVMEGATGERCQLSDLVARIEAGRSFGGSAPPAGPDEWGIVKVSAMTWGQFKPEENKAVPAARVDPRFEIHPGDLLVSRANTSAYVGASVLVGDTRPRLLLSDKSLRIIPASGVDPFWLHLALSAPAARGQISARATGTKDSMRNISQPALLAIQVPRRAPADQVMDAIRCHALLESTEALKEAVGAAQRRAAPLRRALLAAAFSGRLTGRSSDLDRAEEMASA